MSGGVMERERDESCRRGEKGHSGEVGEREKTTGEKCKRGGECVWDATERERDRQEMERRDREREESGEREVTVLITELNEGEETAQREINAERGRDNNGMGWRLGDTVFVVAGDLWSLV
jgi:hypothetical protein